VCPPPTNPLLSRHPFLLRPTFQPRGDLKIMPGPLFPGELTRFGQSAFSLPSPPFWYGKIVLRKGEFLSASLSSPGVGAVFSLSLLASFLPCGPISLRSLSSLQIFPRVQSISTLVDVDGFWTTLCLPQALPPSSFFFGLYGLYAPGSLPDLFPPSPLCPASPPFPKNLVVAIADT